MTGPHGHGMLCRVRSHKKLRIVHPMDMMEPQVPVHRRQHSDDAPVPRPSSARAEFKGHWPPIEWDPLKLNPPVPEVPHAPARLHERQPLQILPGGKRSLAGHDGHDHHRPCRPHRLHHSDSGLSLQGYHDFELDLASSRERGAAAEVVPVVPGPLDRRGHRQLQRVVGGGGGDDDDAIVLHDKGWPSPSTSVGSDHSWLEDARSPDGDDDAVERSHELWHHHADGAEDEDEDALPSPQRRPQVGSPDDPGYFLKRGAWKRRGIFFGAQSAEVDERDDDAFDL